MEGAQFVPVDSVLMHELIRKTIFAAGDNDTSYVLNGIFMSLSRRKRLPDRDGRHRRTPARRPEEDEGSAKAETGSAIIPKKSANELKKLLDEGEGDLKMALSKNHIVFNIGSLYMVTRLIEGNYPNYEQVIPTTTTRRSSWKRSSLSAA